LRSSGVGEILKTLNGNTRESEEGRGAKRTEKGKNVAGGGVAGTKTGGTEEDIKQGTAKVVKQKR